MCAVFEKTQKFETVINGYQAHFDKGLSRCNVLWSYARTFEARLLSFDLTYYCSLHDGGMSVKVFYFGSCAIEIE